MPKRQDWNPNPTGKGLTPWAKKWNNTPTMAIRLPEVFSETITALARQLDQGSITPEQVESMIRGETPQPTENPNLTPYQYALIEEWRKNPTPREEIEAAGMAWLFNAHGVEVSPTRFKVNLPEALLNWIHSPAGVRAIAASTAPTKPRRKLTKADYDQIDHWGIKPNPIQSAHDKGMPWILNAPGVIVGSEKFMVKDWILLWEWLNAGMPEGEEEE